MYKTWREETKERSFFAFKGTQISNPLVVYASGMSVTRGLQSACIYSSKVAQVDEVLPDLTTPRWRKE